MTAPAREFDYYEGDEQPKVVFAYPPRGEIWAHSWIDGMDLSKRLDPDVSVPMNNCITWAPLYVEIIRNPFLRKWPCPCGRVIWQIRR